MAGPGRRQRWGRTALGGAGGGRGVGFIAAPGGAGARGDRRLASVAAAARSPQKSEGRDGATGKTPFLFGPVGTNLTYLGRPFGATNERTAVL